jgi:hypothetical protein
MPLNDVYTLGEVRANRIVIECEKCSRRGEWSTARLIEKYGADMGMPGLRNVLVTCPNQVLNENASCQAMYSKETRLSWS